MPWIVVCCLGLSHSLRSSEGKEQDAGSGSRSGIWLAEARFFRTVGHVDVFIGDNGGVYKPYKSVEFLSLSIFSSNG